MHVTLTSFFLQKNKQVVFILQRQLTSSFFSQLGGSWEDNNAHSLKSVKMKGRKKFYSICLQKCQSSDLKHSEAEMNCSRRQWQGQTNKREWARKRARKHVKKGGFFLFQMMMRNWYIFIEINECKIKCAWWSWQKLVFNEWSVSVCSIWAQCKLKAAERKRWEMNREKWLCND